jgi:transposase-like protein
MSDLSNPIFTDEAKARAWLEARIWPDGPVCQRCGVVNQATLMKGKSHRPGLYQCNACREPFSVTMGTLYERSHVPLNKWLAATHLMMASKKGISALQVGRMLGLSKKTAWFLCHRIRESLRETNPGLLGGEGSTVEIDETYIGGKDKNRHRNKRAGKGGMDREIAFALVERGGKVRTHHVPSVNAKTLRPILQEQIHAETKVYSDDGGARLGTEFVQHGTVNHSIGEYVRGDIHTNTVEGYFSIMKRGINGVYHHVSAQHLKRYLAEFDFRYNEREKLGVNDAERMSRAVGGIVGKRLTYRRPD